MNKHLFTAIFIYLFITTQSTYTSEENHTSRPVMAIPVTSEENHTSRPVMAIPVIFLVPSTRLETIDDINRRKLREKRGQVPMRRALGGMPIGKEVEIGSGIFLTKISTEKEERVSGDRKRKIDSNDTSDKENPKRKKSRTEKKASENIEQIIMSLAKKD